MISIGQKAEKFVAKYLQKKGLILITNNYNCRWGEIDLIMQDAEYLAFIEVRFRSRRDYVTGSQSVDYRKQQKIIKTASHYLQRQNDSECCRFDVVDIWKTHLGLYKLNWLPDAFQII